MTQQEWIDPVSSSIHIDLRGATRVPWKFIYLTIGQRTTTPTYTHVPHLRSSGRTVRILNAQNRRHCSVPPSTISLKKLKSLLRVLTAFTHFFTVTTTHNKIKWLILLRKHWIHGMPSFVIVQWSFSLRLTKLRSWTANNASLIFS